MNEIINRLEMVKAAILLEDDDIVGLQIQKLSQLTLDDDAVNILSLLKSRSFATIISLIENYCHRKKGLVSYNDKEVSGLRLELKMLEAEYEDLLLKKLSIESVIYDFNCQYYHNCGKLIDAVLLYRAKLQLKRAKETPDDTKTRDAFKEAKKDYENFRKDYEEKIEEPLVVLDEADEKELKTAYRKASTLCHPDKVSDEFKEQTTEIFKQLNIANKAKDLNKVREILATLQSGKGFSIFSDTVSDADKLRLRITSIREKMVVISEQIEQAQQDETYQIIEIIDDWNTYFNDIKLKLREELIKLKDALEEVVEKGECVS